MPVKHFWLKLALFVLPLALYGLLLIALPVAVGEFIPLEQVVARQREDAFLFARAHRDDFVPYKYQSVVARQPAVLVIGSSRAMQFRAELFTEPGDFYNAGGAGNSVYQTYAFLTALPESALPEVLIVGLDQPWFNPNNFASSAASWTAPLDRTGSDTFNDLLNYSRILLLDLLKRPDQLMPLVDYALGRGADARVGLAAVRAGAGFRSDGSYDYGSLATDFATTEERLREMNERIDTGGVRFEYATDYAREPLPVLEALLIFCAEHDIQMIGFLPPYPAAIYDRMIREGNYGYLAGARAAVSDLFAAHGVPLFDFTDGASIAGQGDETYVDGLHGSERTYTAMFAVMVEAQPDILGVYADSLALRARLEAPYTNPLILFAD